jgi:Protein of unknown function (DUF2877)
MVNMAAEGHSLYGAASSTVLLPVLTGTPVAGRLLGASAKGIYLAFDNARNADEIATVLALLPTSSVRLPLAMVAAEVLPDVAGNDPIVVGDGALRVGSHSWKPMRWFDPRPAAGRSPDPASLAMASESLWNLDVDDVGLSPFLAWDAAAALASGDPGPCSRLLGAGPGLTPAGDDVVAGALAACALTGTGPGTDDVELLLHRAATATTALSAALLACAARGQVVPQAAELLHTLGTGAPIVPALNRLRAVGSTSGTALALGLVSALTVASAAAVTHSPFIQLGPRLPFEDAPAGSVSATERPQSWAAAR